MRPTLRAPTQGNPGALHWGPFLEAAREFRELCDAAGLAGCAEPIMRMRSIYQPAVLRTVRLYGLYDIQSKPHRNCGEIGAALEWSGDWGRHSMSNDGRR